ncbi:MAG: hypothetical protein V1837_07860 [Candidatus Woesearchaeota archaeon]
MINRRNFLQAAIASGVGLTLLSIPETIGPQKRILGPGSKLVEDHCHLYYKGFSLEQVVDAMDRNDIDIIALERLNGRIYNKLQQQTKKIRKYRVDSDRIAIRIEKDGRDFFILRATEVQSCDYFHLLIIGSDRGLFRKDSREIIDRALKDNALVKISHSYANVKNFGREITKEKEKELIQICREYKDRIALEWNGYCIGWLRQLLLDGDINDKAYKLSLKLQNAGYNVPLVAGTDIHARSVEALDAIGRAGIEAHVDTSSGQQIINSLKEQIFAGKHRNTYKTVSLWHFAANFGVPYAYNMYVRPLLEDSQKRKEFRGKGTEV